MQLAAALAFQSSNLGSAMKTVEPEPAEASGAENGAEEALLMAIAGTPSLAEAIGRDELLIIVAGLLLNQSTHPRVFNRKQGSPKRIEIA